MNRQLRPGGKEVSPLEKSDRILLHLNRLSLFCHATLTVLLIIVTVAVALALFDLVTLESTPYWLLFIVFGLSVSEFIAAIIANELLRKNTGSLLEIDTQSTIGDSIIKRKFSWMYSPDKLEQWIEQMENQGYTLQRIGKRGRSFYFTKGTEKIKEYWVDFQLMADTKYYITNGQANWRPLFVTFGSFGKWTIWTREASPGQAPQPSCRNNSHLVSHGFRTAIAYSGVLISMLLLTLSGIKALAEVPLNAHTFAVTLFLFALILLSLIQTTSRAWLYYWRQKSLSRSLS